jgi:hypothetical protein
MPRINLQHIAQSHFVLVGVVALLLAACGSSHEVIYRCDGSADEVRAEYIGPDGAPTEETSGLPWQVTLSFSGDRVETDLTVTNLGDTGDVSCEVLIDNVSQFDTAGDRGVMITGTVERSGNTTRAQYSGGPILAEEPETEAEIAAGSGCDLGFGLGEECQVTTNDEWTPVIETFGGVDMALVPTGCFMMGSSEEEIDVACELRGDGLSGTGCDRDDFEDEKPQHEQCFDEPFWIDVTEVTNGQYGSEGGFSGDNRPRESVEWAEAEAHCQSRGARLPTEAEWEYAARGPDGLIFAWGDEFVPDNVVYGENSGGQTSHRTLEQMSES